MSLARCATARRMSSWTRTTASPVMGSRGRAVAMGDGLEQEDAKIGRAGGLSPLLSADFFGVERRRAYIVDAAAGAVGLARVAATAAVEDEDVGRVVPIFSRE